jgi:hypothetical protein
MKKTLLSIALIGSAFAASSQTMIFSDNFNSYPEGNLSNDLTGATPGLGNWGTITATSGDNAATQIVSVGTDDNALQISGLAGPSASGTTRFVYHSIDNPNTGWPSRVTGQDVVQLDFNFNAGSATTSLNTFSGFIYDDNDNRIVGIGFNQKTKSIVGLFYYEFPPVAPATTTTKGLAQTDLVWDQTLNAGNGGFKQLILNADEVVHIRLIYSTVTGQGRVVVFHTVNSATVVDYADFNSPVSIGSTPAYIQYYVSAGSGNAVSGTVSIDDVEVRAQSCVDPEVAEFSYGTDHGCVTDPSLSSVQADAAVTGVYTSLPTGLVDASTGTINLANATDGTYKVTFTSTASPTATVNRGCSEVHSETIVISQCAGLEELSSENFTVFPNPANDVVTVSLADNARTGSIVLTSADGKVIETRNYSNSSVETFNVKSLTSGIYFFQVGNSTQRVIVK